ncbi:Uncharacterised protein [Yersinia mollaretii]|nr:Uncharacterised protein [Yersinia mollaretii]
MPIDLPFAAISMAGIYTLNNSSCRKAATERVPRSLHESVTGVNEGSQRTCSLKYDGYNL